MINRRGLLRGLGAFLAAPAIVRVSALMPISTALMPAPVPFGCVLFDSAAGRYRMRVDDGWLNLGTLAPPLHDWEAPLVALSRTLPEDAFTVVTDRLAALLNTELVWGGAPRRRQAPP